MSQNAEDHLPEYRVRPRFQIETTYSIQELCEKIRLGLEKENASCKGRITANEFATLYLPISEQHYWSPQLSLTFKASKKGCLLRGLYGPRPGVWTMFVFFYSIIGFAILIILMIGSSYLMLDLPAPFLWWVPVLCLMFLTLYLVAFIGQKKGHDQMITLHQFLEESTGLEIIDQQS